MAIRSLRWILFLVLFFVFTSVQARLKNVLVLHSYNSGLSWTDNINKGIFEAFSNELFRTADLRCEYLDAKHFESTIHFQNFRDYLSHKYANTPVDLIICSDNPAFNFLNSYRKELFGDIPVVFCGLNYCDSVPQNFTGVFENIQLEENLRLITTIHPHYSKLYIINDRSITGKSISLELSRVIKKNFQNLRYEFLTDYTMDGLKSKLSTLKENDVVLMLLFNFDKEGNTFSFDMIMNDLAPKCKVPIYGTWGFYLGKGIVGGKITLGYDQGLLAGSMAQGILSGKPLSFYKPVDGSSQFMFDYNVIKKFSIEKKHLPVEAKIINRPYDFILDNLALFLLILVIFILLILLVFLLAWQVKITQYNLKKEQDLVTQIEEKSSALEVALEKAEQSDKLKAAFLSNISHEIRTPMNGILGFTSLLKDHYPSGLGKEYLNTIQQCVEQLLNTINDIVEIALIETNQIKAHYKEVSINQTIRNFAFIFSHHPNFGNHELKLHCGLDDLVSIIETDEVKFNQVLMNLLTNALKFSPKGAISLGYQKKGGYIEFFVKDQGIGIAPENHLKIFERFFYVDHSGETLYRGNGLGLSISKSYIELLGGKIWVESELGKGATFYFTLPMKRLNLF